METTTDVTMASAEGSCPECKKHASEQAESQETSMAFLLALVPVLVLTFFGQVGLL